MSDKSNPLDLVKASAGFPTRVGSVVYKSESHEPATGFQGRHMGDLAKSGRWQNIPGGKHGGQRKKVGGKWRCRYPSIEAATAAYAHHKCHAAPPVTGVRLPGSEQHDASARSSAAMHAEHAEGTRRFLETNGTG